MKKIVFSFIGLSIALCLISCKVQVNTKTSSEVDKKAIAMAIKDLDRKMYGNELYGKVDSTLTLPRIIGSAGNCFVEWKSESDVIKLVPASNNVTMGMGDPMIKGNVNQPENKIAVELKAVIIRNNEKAAEKVYTVYVNGKKSNWEWKIEGEMPKNSYVDKVVTYKDGTTTRKAIKEASTLNSMPVDQHDNPTETSGTFIDSTTGEVKLKYSFNVNPNNTATVKLIKVKTGFGEWKDVTKDDYVLRMVNSKGIAGLDGKDLSQVAEIEFNFDRATQPIIYTHSDVGQLGAAKWTPGVAWYLQNGTFSHNSATITPDINRKVTGLTFKGPADKTDMPYDVYYSADGTTFFGMREDPETKKTVKIDGGTITVDPNTGNVTFKYGTQEKTFKFTGGMFK